MKMTHQEAEDFFSEIYFGLHHIPSKIKEFGRGWSINHYGDIATFDSNALTRLVFLAHDAGYRVGISQGSPRHIKISIWKRGRDGGITEYHPTLENALAKWRQNHPCPE